MWASHPLQPFFFWSALVVLGLWHAGGLYDKSIVPSVIKDEFDLEDSGDAITCGKYACHCIALLLESTAILITGSAFLFFCASPTKVFADSVRLFPMLAAVLFAAEAIVIWTAVRSYRAAMAIQAAATSTGIRLDHNDKIHPPNLLRAVRVLFWMAFAGMAAWSWTFVPLSENAFLHFRDLHLGSGVAPCLPIVVLLAVFYTAVWVHLHRISRWEYGSIDLPTMQLDDTFPSDCNRQVANIDNWMLAIPRKHWRSIIVIACVTTFVLYRPWATLDMVEPQWLHVLLMCWFFLALLALWSNCIRFLGVWTELHAILITLDRLPIRAAFSRLPKESSLAIWDWGVAPNRLLPTREAVETLRALAHEDDRAVSHQTRRLLLQGIHLLCTNAAITQSWQSEDGAVEKSMAAVATGDSHDAGSSVSSMSARRQPGARDIGRTGSRKKWLLRKTREAMTAVIAQLIPYLGDYWRRGERLGEGGVNPEQATLPTNPANRKFELAEDLVALRFYSYIRYVGTELRSLVFFVVSAFLLLFLALHIYAFRSDQAIDISFLVLFLALGTAIVVVLVQLERDSLLSRLQETTPGRLGRNFYVDIVKYGAIPLLTIIGSQIPSLSNFILQWVQPSLDAFR